VGTIRIVSLDIIEGLHPAFDVDTVFLGHGFYYKTFETKKHHRYKTRNTGLISELSTLSWVYKIRKEFISELYQGALLVIRL